MNKKALEKLCILLIITVFIIIGYYTYKSYENKKSSNDSDVEINNFYNVDYLFNNSYIDTPKTIEDFSSEEGNIYIYLDNNIMNIKYNNNKEYNKTITGLSKEKATVYYNHLYNDYYEFLGKTDKGDIYYAFTNLSDSNNEEFKLIGSNIDKVYTPSYDKDGVYVNKDDEFATKYILYDNDENLKYIDISFKNKYVLKSNIKTKKPYFDYICADINSYLCNKLMVYISFENELIYNKKSLKNGNNEKIYIKDIFSSFEIDSNKNIDLETLNKKSLKKHNYVFSTYIIDVNQMAYQYNITNKGESLIPLSSEENKVKEYIYEPDKKLLLVFEDGTNKEIKTDKNKVITTSTIYDKNKSNNDKVLIKP